MGVTGVVFYQIDSRQLPTRTVGVILKQMALLVNGTPGDGSSLAYDLRAGIRHSDDGTYWVGFNAMYWGNLFELILARYRVPVRRAGALPDGSQPELRDITARRDAGRVLSAPLTEEEQKMSTVDEALDMLSHAARGALRRRLRGRR